MIIIIDGEKKKKYAKIDRFLERAYETKVREEEFMKEAQKARKRHLDEILSNVNISAERKEGYIRQMDNLIQPLTQEQIKHIKIISSHGDALEKVQNEVKKIRIEEMRIKITDEKLRQIIRGNIDVSK